MSILKVARMGHPILRQIALPVDLTELETPRFQQFIDDMIETLREYSGVGLAAPQVHRSIRVAVVELSDQSPQVFINPEITSMTSERDSNWEGCLSVPGMRGLVQRANKIKVRHLDRQGVMHELDAEGFFAIVIGHECDHLDGKLYIDRLASLQDFVFEDEFERYVLPAIESKDQKL